MFNFQANELDGPSPAQARASDQVFLDVKGVAELVGFSVDWVYEHKDEFGVMRCGDGPKPRLRFRSDLVHAAMETRCASRVKAPKVRADRNRISRKKQSLGDSHDGYLLPLVERR